MDFQQPHSRDAYFVLDAIANFNNYLKALTTGIENSQTDSNSFTDNWVKQFSYTTAVQSASTSHIKEILNEIAAGLLILLTIASVAVPGLGELDAVGTAAGVAAGVQAGIFSAVANSLPSAQ